MQYPDWLKETVGEARELLPRHERPLAAPPECPEPVPSHLGVVPPQARIVAGDGVVVQVPGEHPTEPCPGLGDGMVQSPAQFHLDRL